MILLFEVILVSFILCGCYIISYFGAFNVCLLDDVEFRHGKGRIKRRRRTTKNFWTKFLFLDIRKEVITWHYVMFWINLIAFTLALIATNTYIVFGFEIMRQVFVFLGMIWVITSAIIVFQRWTLYAGNKVRSRKEYRK